MRHLRANSLFTLAVCGLTVVFTMIAPRSAMAYVSSEKEQMEEDVREAVSRARDFKAQKIREATEDLARERGAFEVKRRRAEFEAEQEESRQAFVVDRNSRPSETLLFSRLERQDERERLLDERMMEKNRQKYARDRKTVQRQIQTKAHIDENQEFGL